MFRDVIGMLILFKKKTESNNNNFKPNFIAVLVEDGDTY